MGLKMRTKCLILGAGISGLSFASKLNEDDYIIIEKESTVGGYCKTFHQDGYTWDYAGHFFHFQDNGIKEEFTELLCAQDTVYNQKCTKIYYNGTLIDYPFQFNIHQLEKSEFIECLCDLFQKSEYVVATTFKQMLYKKFGKSIADKFLIPYNTKLYACDLDELDVNAMGRFFPYAEPEKIIESFRTNAIATYNSEFFYSPQGAAAVVSAICKHIDNSRVFLNEEAVEIDIARKTVTTNKRTIEYERLVSTLPFSDLLNTANIKHVEGYSANKVLVFNMGFDLPAKDKAVHWIYYPDESICFYRVGFYNNILHQDKLSIYVELGFQQGTKLDIEKIKGQVITDLTAVGIIDGHKLVSYNYVFMDPAYVHVDGASQDEKENIKKSLLTNGVYIVGRYGDWRYCSMEDCIKQAHLTACEFNKS